MYDYARRFGFGGSTGVGLPAESSGLVRRLNRWRTTSLASIAMGHEVSTTSIQLALACAAIANGGLMIKPKLVFKEGDRQTPTEPPVRILKPETAITMRQMMEGVVISPHGTAHRHVRLAGYTVGGKTGTAQIFDLTTHRYTHLYNASFMGFAPVTNPAFIIVVTLNGTTGNGGMGGAVAGPVFQSVATEALRVLDVPKDLPDAAPEKEETAHADDSNDLAIADLGSPEPNVMEELAAQNAPETGPKVPNFQGKTMRAVVAEAAALGLPLSMGGSGIARAQFPPAGSPLREGDRVRVRFAR
jgi:cell division protein FtsI (penicillin-binding protein 3)